MGWGYAIGAATEATNAYFTSRSQKRETKRNRAFQERMYKNRYTYAVDDLKRAGLNPILAAGSLGGGGSPAGSQANYQKADISGAISSAASGKRADTERQMLNDQMANIRSQTQLNDQQVKKVEQDVLTNKALQAQYETSARKNLSDIRYKELGLEFINAIGGKGIANSAGSVLRNTGNQVKNFKPTHKTQTDYKNTTTKKPSKNAKPLTDKKGNVMKDLLGRPIYLKK
ncbi:DNA pilot protein [Microviridae sp.]|nr:DNA pilot protein [Microviridae sp.]